MSNRDNEARWQARLDNLKQNTDAKLENANRRIDLIADATRRARSSSLKLDCYDLATKAVGDGPLGEVLDEAKRLHDWATGVDAVADGSEDLGGRRYGSLHPPTS